MSKITSLLLIAASALLVGSPVITQSALGQAAKAPAARKSPHETVNVRLGEERTLVSLTYGRPYSNKREIWGKLVPWDKAYRLGADEATLLLSAKPLTIGGQRIPAGAHTLYMVPSSTGASKLVVSKHIGKWGVPVDESQDVVRVDLKKGSLAAPVDQLTIALEKEGTGGLLKIMWENTQYSVPFAVAK